MLMVVFILILGGDLEKVIKNAQGQYISEKKILGWLFQICSAINYIHNNKIIHRDIKASNIFLTRRGDIKLGDFGISRILEETLEKVQSWLGTPYYVSPQIINRESYTNKTDIWSLGVLLYRLCALKYPFEGTDYLSIYQLIIRGRYQPIPDQYSNHLKSLIENMLQIDESRRPTAQQILDSIENRLTKYQSELKLQQLQQQQQQHLDQLFQNDNRMVNHKEDLPLFPRLPFLWAPLRHQIIQTPQQKHPLGMANGYQHRIEQKIASDRPQNKIIFDKQERENIFQINNQQKYGHFRVPTEFPKLEVPRIRALAPQPHRHFENDEMERNNIKKYKRVDDLHELSPPKLKLYKYQGPKYNENHLGNFQISFYEKEQRKNGYLY